MKRILWILAALVVGLLAGAASAQSTAVTGQVSDTSGQTWNNGSYTITFVPKAGVSGPYYWNGSQFTPQAYTGSLDSAGNISVTLPTNTSISPAGTQWLFTVCPQAKFPCNPVNITLTSSSQNVGSALSTGNPPIAFNPTPVNYGYSNSEVNPMPGVGQIYYDTTLQAEKFWNGSIWSEIATGGSNPCSGATGPCIVANPTVAQTVTQPINTSFSFATSGTGQLLLNGNPVCSYGQTGSGCTLLKSFDCSAFSGSDASYKYNACVAAVVAAKGGIADARKLFDYNINGVVTVSETMYTNTSPESYDVLTLLPEVASLTANFTGTSVFQVNSRSTIVSLGNSAAGGGQFLIALGSSASLSDACVTTDPSPSGGGSYVSIGGLTCYNILGGTTANGLFHAQNLLDQSKFYNLTAINRNGKGFVVNNVCCGFVMDRIQNSQWSATTYPPAACNGQGIALDIQSDNNGPISLTNSTLNTYGCNVPLIHLASGVYGFNATNDYSEKAFSAASSTPDTTPMVLVDSGAINASFDSLTLLNGSTAGLGSSDIFFKNSGTGFVVRNSGVTTGGTPIDDTVAAVAEPTFSSGYVSWYHSGAFVLDTGTFGGAATFGSTTQFNGMMTGINGFAFGYGGQSAITADSFNETTIGPAGSNHSSAIFDCPNDVSSSVTPCVDVQNGAMSPTHYFTIDPTHASNPGAFHGSYGSTVKNSGGTAIGICLRDGSSSDGTIGDCNPGTPGTVTSVTSGNFSPLFTVAVATNTTTPAFTFTASNFAANTVFMNNTSGSAAPTAVTTANAFINFYETVATTLGDEVYGGASGAPTRLAGPTGAASTTYFYTNTTNGSSVAQAPAWESPSTARTALGLGTAATQNTGTSGANVPLMNAQNTFSNSAATPIMTVQSTGTGAFVNPFSVLAPNLTTTQHICFNVGVAAATNNWGSICFLYAGSGSTSNAYQFFFNGGASPVLSMTAAGVVTTLNNTLDDGSGNMTAKTINLTATQTTVNCSTSGTAIFSQPQQGSSDKKVLIHLSACLGTASYTYPTAFANTPSIYASNNVAAGIATSVSTSAVTVTGTTSTGSLVLEDY